MSAGATPDQQGEPAVGHPSKTASSKKKEGGRNPPAHSRFKPGVSGNPRGRPRGKESLKSTLARVLHEKIEVRDGNKMRTMTKYEAILQAQSLKAMQGNTPAASFIQGLANMTGLFAGGEDEGGHVLSKEDAAILNDYVRQQAAALEAEAKSGLH